MGIYHYKFLDTYFMNDLLKELQELHEKRVANIEKMLENAHKMTHLYEDVIETQKKVIKLMEAREHEAHIEYESPDVNCEACIEAEALAEMAHEAHEEEITNLRDN